MLGEGPKTQWEHEMERLPKQGLIFMVWVLLRTGGYHQDHAEILSFVREAKQVGRSRNQTIRIQRLLADPRGYSRECERRSKAAKRAARRRKKGGR